MKKECKRCEKIVGRFHFCSPTMNWIDKQIQPEVDEAIKECDSLLKEKDEPVSTKDIEATEKGE